MALDDGMPDLGNLPQRTLAVRNKLTQQVQTRESLARGIQNPEEEDPWSILVRYAYNHQDQMELLSYIPGADGKGADPVKGPGADESKIPTTEDGRPLIFETLESLHFQTLRKLCKQYKGNPDGKTKLQVIEAILTGAYQEAGLPIPAMPTV